MIDTTLLLSGGLDSTALAYHIEPDHAITVDYGQETAEAEITASEQICDSLDLSHHVIRVDCSGLGTGPLANKEQLSISPTPEWWPFRNQLIITLSAIDAVKRGPDKLVLGTVKNDDDHADGMPQFFELIDELVSLQEGGLRISAPAIEMTSMELVVESGVPLELLGWTHSCHTSNQACGTCRGCVKRQEVIDEVFHS